MEHVDFEEVKTRIVKLRGDVLCADFDGLSPDAQLHARMILALLDQAQVHAEMGDMCQARALNRTHPPYR